MAFRNNPNFPDGPERIEWVHQPLVGDHYGIHYSIQANGKVIISSGGTSLEGGEVEYDEIEVPASLIFKLVMLLKATRMAKEPGASVAEKP